MAEKCNDRMFIPKLGGGIRVRFLGPNEEMYLYFNKNDLKVNFFRRQKEVNLEATHYISKRVVSFVIDRDDNDRIKLLDCPIVAWKEVLKDGMEPEVYIVRRGAGKNTKYTVVRGEIYKTTEEQEEMVRRTHEAFNFTHTFINNKEWYLISGEFEPIVSRFDILDL